MTDSPPPAGDRPPNPVVRHGRSPAPTVGPVRGDRATPPRPGAVAPPREWPGPVLRRLRDPLPDGYSPRSTARGETGDELPDVDPELRATFDPTLTPEATTPLRVPEPGPLSAVTRKLGRSLVPGERILVAQTRHPVVLAEPVLTSVLVLLGIAAVSPYLGAADLARNALMVGWVVLAVRALWSWLQWSNDYFVVTDRRLIRLHGLLDVQRDMMPLTKVTDMAFQRPFWGRPFNYGRFVLESAGMDQALREIRFVRDPEEVDAIIGRQVFARAPYQPGPGR